MISDLTLYGALDFPIDHPKITLRPNGLDSVTQVFQNRNALAFARGGRFPGLPNFFITESEPTIEIENLANEIRVRGEGLADGQDREEDNEVTVTDEGWDQGPMTWLTLNPDRYQRGIQHPHMPSLWLLDVQKKRVAGPRNSMEGLWRVSGDHKGILLQANGLPKGRKRQITVGNQTGSSSSTMALDDPLVFKNEAGAFTGWYDQRFTAMDASRVQVSDTFITFDEPPTDKLPGHLTPENAPAVFDIFGLPWWSTGFTFNWPWGWSLKSVSSTPLLYGLAGTPHLTTLVTEFVPKAILR